MYITVDLSSVPPAVELCDPHDFASFSVRVVPARHAWVAPETLRSLAGGLGSLPEWNEGLEAMTAFARRHGWLDESGAIRAHVENDPG